MTRTHHALVLALALAACDGGPTGPGAGDERIEVRVTGGIAAADYAYRVEGGAVTGIACGNLCDFRPGDTLLVLTPAQRRALSDAVRASGLPRWEGPEDSGTACCDQLHYAVAWSSEGLTRRFGGSDALLPAPFRDLVRSLQLMRQGIPPLVMSQEKGLDGLRADPLQILAARVQAGVLEVEVEWGGGCAPHDVDAVAWTGWMESNPVQVGVALAHDAHGDACKALLRRTLRFDLEPLRTAYGRAYGPGPATLALRLGVASGGGTVALLFAF